MLAETDEGMTGHIEYSTHLFDRETIERMRGHYRALLEALVSDPERAIDAVPMLTADEYRTIVRDWNDTARDYPRSTHPAPALPRTGCAHPRGGRGRRRA